MGLVRHVATAHFCLTLEVINHAFAGSKVFVKCPYCPERFLAAGVRGHINSKHKDLGSLRGSIGHPAVIRKLTAPTPPKTLARQESQPVPPESGRTATADSVIQRTTQKVTTKVGVQSVSAAHARQTARILPQESDSDCDATTQFVSYDSPTPTTLKFSGVTRNAQGHIMGPNGQPVRGLAESVARRHARCAREKADKREDKIKRALTPGISRSPMQLRDQRRDLQDALVLRLEGIGGVVRREVCKGVPGTVNYVNAAPEKELDSAAIIAVKKLVQPATFPTEDDLIVHAAPWEFGSKDLVPSVPVDIPIEVVAVDIAAAVVEADLDIGDYGSLVGQFHRGAYYKHHSWKVLIRPIVLSLLQDCVSEVEGIATRGIAALQLLPGLVSHCRGLRGKRVWTPIQLLRQIEGVPNKAEEIIRVARSWVSTLRALPSVWRAPSIEHLRARVESLTAESRLSGAATVLKNMEDMLHGVPQQPQPTPEYVTERIAALHPADNERDILPEASLDPSVHDCLQLTADQVRQRFYGISTKNTAAGNTGWSNEWLRMIGDDRNEPQYVHTETPPNVIHTAFTAFFNKILQGRVVGEGRDLIVTARLIMIPKPQGGLRPIRIECAMMRLMSATAAAIARIEVAPLLRPIQLGGGLKCGVEIGARLLDAAYARDDCIISVDIANAFNTTRHRVIWDALAANYPAILRYYRMKYETASKMIGNDGKIIAWSRTGVGQGDPWAGLFFELAVHSALLELSDAVKNVEAQINREHPTQPAVRPGAVSAYEDDTQVRGETAVMFRVAPLIEGIFARSGFTVNVSKSKITGLWAEGLYDPPDGFQVDRDGLVALGVPVGQLGYQQDRITESVREMEAPLAALKLMRPRTAIQLLLSCINSRPAFLLRTASSIDIVRVAAERFDTKMVQAVADVFHLEVTNDLKDRLYLPLRMGGFGLTRHYGMATEKNQLLSRTLFSAYLSQYYPDELQATQQTYDLSVVRLGAVEEMVEATEITQGIMDTLTVKNSGAILGDGMRRAQKAMFGKVYRAAVDEGSFSKAAWLLSAATSTTAYLLSGTAIEHDGYFDPAEFRCAGRNTLGYGPVDAQPGQRRNCGGCQREYTLLTEPFHGMSCPGTKGFRTKRHNEIRDLLFRLIKKRYPLLTNVMLKLEDNVGSFADGHMIRADITWQIEAEKVIVDLVCIDVGCVQYIKPPTRSYLSSERAALHAEKVKRDHYAKVVVPARLSANSVIPFVVEASGRLGPAALGFVNRICGTQTYIKSAFLREISMITAKFRGRMLRTTRDQYHNVL